MGIGGGFPARPSVSHHAPRSRLFLFRVVKPADAGPFCRSNRASSDVTQTTEVAWGEQLETHTHTHTWQKAQKVDFCLESSWVIRTLAAESCRLRRVSQTDLAVWQGGLLSWWDEERLSPSVKFQHPSLPFEERERERGPFKPGLDGKGEGENRTRSVYDSTLCEGRLPWVSLQLSRVERSLGTDTNLF